VQVRDDGRWRTPRPDTNRGRGLYLIEQVMDHVTVVHEPGTTVTMRRVVGTES
jgi:anti-sigma regulatory factor (Ser/Thr protein kinase)